MTVDELKALNLPIKATEEMCLYVEAAIEWVNHNTTLEVDKENLEESVTALPAGAKIFLCRYYDVMATGGNGIASESIGGMSQSFTADTKAALLWQLASELMGDYIKSQISSVPNVSKWV